MQAPSTPCREYSLTLMQCMLAGGLGGSTGDMLMHSLDTVKTRQQGDTSFPPRYPSLPSAYARIFRQEGFLRGLYAGVTPAFFGSFPGTIIFFGTYEYSKRTLLDARIFPSVAYLAAGFVADLAASVVYVPSEVLKTRLQLQGRHNNPFTRSGYNYRSTLDALRTIVRTEGVTALFQGYKATLARDLPFSALQFAFYEQEQGWAKRWAGGPNIGLPLEIATATTAGGLAGVLTCPLDVVKTRIQTAVQPGPAPSRAQPAMRPHEPVRDSAMASQHVATAPSRAPSPPPPRRNISTSSPSTCRPQRPPSCPTLDTSSVLRGLALLFREEGLAGWFRGVGPRAVWTSVQSGVMLVCYQALLRRMQKTSLFGWEEGRAVV